MIISNWKSVLATANTDPKWWQLYLAVPLLIALFMLDAQLKISTRGHQVIQIGIILFVYGLLCMWVNAKATALLRRDGRMFIVIHFLTSANKETDNVLEMSDPEVKGMFRYTYEPHISIWTV